VSCCKGAHFPKEIIRTGVRWDDAYPLSTRHIEELMLERGVHVDHSPMNRWVIQDSPPLEEAFHRRKRPVWVSWRMDETYMRIKGERWYLYRVVDKHGHTIDFLLTAQRDKEAALRFLKKAIRWNGVPETITLDGSEATAAAIKSYNEEHGIPIVIRQGTYVQNIVGQDHRGVKRVTRPMPCSSRLRRLSTPWLVLNWYTCYEKGRWKMRTHNASLRPHSSTLSPRHHPTDRGDSPHIGHTQKLATESFSLFSTGRSARWRAKPITSSPSTTRCDSALHAWYARHCRFPRSSRTLSVP
jgi:putative transposase